MKILGKFKEGIGYLLTHRFRPLSGLIGTALLGACSATTSEDLATSKLYVTFAISGNSVDQANCEVRFYVGNSTLGTQVELSTGDSVQCSDGTSTRTLVKTGTAALGTLRYVSETSLTYSTSTSYTLTFSRTGETYEASTALPAAITITAPVESSTQTRSAALTVSWNAGDSSDTLAVRISGTQGGSSSSVTQYPSDVGSYTFVATDTVFGSLTAPFTGGLEISGREISGTQPTGLSGTTRGYQSRTVSFQWVD